MANATHLLLADSSHSARQRLAAELREAGYIVSEAADAVAATQRLIDACPHAALCAVDLPGARRCEAIRLMRAVLPRLVIVAVSRRPGMDLLASAFVAGATSCLVKPISMERLAELLPDPVHYGETLPSSAHPAAVARSWTVMAESLRLGLDLTDLHRQDVS